MMRTGSASFRPMVAARMDKQVVEKPRPVMPFAAAAKANVQAMMTISPAEKGTSSMVYRCAFEAVSTGKAVVYFTCSMEKVELTSDNPPRANNH